MTGARPDASEFDGTITTDSGTVVLVSQVQHELQLQGLATFQSSGTIQGSVFVPEPTPGDSDGDGDVDLADWANWPDCATGPVAWPYVGGCGAFDFDGDLDIDLGDFAGFQVSFGG